MSLDSFIVFEDKFKKDKKNFIKMLDEHIIKMKKSEKSKRLCKIKNKLLPFSARFINEGLKEEDFIEMFEKYIVKD